MKMHCVHRLLKCPECKEFVKEYVYKEHRSSQCLQRLCGCPNAVAGCVEILPWVNVDRHLKLRCKVRLVDCRLHCGASVPIRSLADHEEHHCCKRLIACGVCDLEVVSQHIAVHRHNDCCNRKVKCRVGCGRVMMAKDLEAHEVNDCIAPCKYHCGQLIGPLAKRTLHELQHCENRPRQVQQIRVCMI
jgi:hypothetical protein